MHNTGSSKPSTEMTSAGGRGSIRVLITGNQGYLGTVVANEISAAGHEVTGLDTGVFADRVLGASPLDPPTLNTDLCDVSVTDLTGFDAVIHLATLPDTGRDATTRHAIGEANYLASARLARAARAAGVSRFLFASTCTAYGAGRGRPTGEDCPLYPTTPWAASKLRVEHELVALADDAFTPVSLRLANVYGFSPRLRTDLPVNRMVAEAVCGGRIASRATDSRRPMIHVKDVADALLRCLTAPTEKLHAGAFNVGSENNFLSAAEIARIVTEAVPGTVLALAPPSGRRRGTGRVDFGRFRQAVGFEARHGVSYGVAELVRAYSTAGMDIDDLYSRFSRAGAGRAMCGTADLEAEDRGGKVPA
ncbi:NAD-dependent epimerase/dehydratase family protein [Dietzia maris]|uniref:NAD(P)-dependent oxidoreductase n=1 Tax=Dietzia maris TaxID=37915 RepID=A0AAE4TZ79_9ACTN|nr:NAD(P)-dependent oxidoreductase [Dietzia maris]MDV6298575.1 NAD(P)-dependent oxidoreductase [Dietzia maris]